MHVLQLGPFPPPHGGVQTNLVAIRKYLLDRELRCSVINLTRFRRTDHAGVYYPSGAAAVVKLILHLRPDIIHLHIGGAITTRLLLLAVACCAIPHSRTVLTLHSGGYPSSPEGRSAHPWTLRGFVFRRLDRLIVVNEELRNLLRSFGVKDERIRLIAPHALPAHPTASLPEQLQRFFADHTPVLLSMGWLEPEYDFALQIRVLGSVRSRHPQAGLVIMGAGRLQKELEQQVESTPYAAHVLMPGDIPHEIALTAIARSDVFLRTTLYDGDSISVREALHLGTPVVATDNGMRPPGVLLFPVSGVAALDRAIEEAIKLAGSRPEEVRAAEDSNIQTVFDLYQELVP